jgi:hypothetical protein
MNQFSLFMQEGNLPPYVIKYSNLLLKMGQCSSNYTALTFKSTQAPKGQTQLAAFAFFLNCLMEKITEIIVATRNTTAMG